MLATPVIGSDACAAKLSKLATAVPARGRMETAEYDLRLAAPPWEIARVRLFRCSDVHRLFLNQCLFPLTPNLSMLLASQERSRLEVGNDPVS